MSRRAVVAIAVALCAQGCAHSNPLTIAPREVVSEQASFDANTQNSGVVSVDKNGFVVTEHFLDRHAIKHGAFLRDAGVSEEANHTFRITAEVMARCIEQDRQRKNKQS